MRKSALFIFCLPGMMLAACDRPHATEPTIDQKFITVYGIITRQDVGEPVWTTVTIDRIELASVRDVTVASTQSGTDGHYTLRFSARCDGTMYALRWNWVSNKLPEASGPIYWFGRELCAAPVRNVDVQL
jgi:hypothetical protein